MLDKAGVPRDERWRTLILYMRGLGEFSHLTDGQKARIQQLLVDVLKNRDFSEAIFDAVMQADHAIRSEPFEQRMREALQETERLAREFQAMLRVRRGDMDRMEQQSVDAVESGVDPREIVHLLRSTFSEVRAQLESDAARVDELTVTDPLTGLGNRRAFDAALGAGEVAWRAGRQLALIVFDVDHFKRVNDEYGHRIGDQVLRTVANILRLKVDERSLPSGSGPEEGGMAAPSATVARFGGEEFAIVLTGEDAAHAVELAEAVRVGLESVVFSFRNSNARQEGERGVRVTLSAGVAHAGPELADSLRDSLFDLADRALYEAKRAGRNRVRVAN